MALSSWYYRLRGTAMRRSVTEAISVVAVGLALLALGLGNVMATAWSGPQTDAWWHALPLVPAGAVMLIKRRHPVGSLLAVLPLLAVDAWLGGSIGMVLVLIDLIYSVALHAGPTAQRRLGVAIAVVIAAGTTATFIVTGNIQLTVLMFIQFFALMATPLWWGISVRRQAELADLASTRAQDLQRLADLREAEVVRAERTRMARDLHDALSANLSTIAIHAEAARGREDLAAAEPGQQTEALTAIRSASLSALEELRTMVLLLRTGEEEITSAADVTDLAALVDDARRTGLTVELSGHVPAEEQLPAAVGHAAYRIVQEALTNAVKHCPRGQVDVTVEAGGTQVQVQVDSSPAPGTRQLSSTPSPGIGLTHMRERAQMLGGTLHAGWTQGPSSCWRVEARLPLAQPQEV